jgi:hypothetical protein
VKKKGFSSWYANSGENQPVFVLHGQIHRSLRWNIQFFTFGWNSIAHKSFHDFSHSRGRYMYKRLKDIPLSFFFQLYEKSSPYCYRDSVGLYWHDVVLSIGKAVLVAKGEIFLRTEILKVALGEMTRIFYWTFLLDIFSQFSWEVKT